MLQPYIHSSKREFVQESRGFDNEQGVIYEEVGGEHAIWAARVPFLPSLMSDDFTRWGKQRIDLVMRRQFRFIYDLSRAQANRATFELRFISTPTVVPGQPNIIDIVFLGKVFSLRHGGWREPAKQLWERFSSTFPLEDPYNYPLEPVTTLEEFMRYYEPFPFDELDTGNLLEIRKFEDMPVASAAPLGRVARKGDYIAHPFVPSTSFSPMSRFFEALAFQPHRCFAGISIRPTRMFDQETHNVSFAIGQFKKTATEDDDVTEEYIRTRSTIGVGVYQQLMAEREHLMMVRVHIVVEAGSPHGLTEALGSELMDNANNPYPTQWEASQPSDGVEMAIALNNLLWLEQDFWGKTKASLPLVRLRYLASAREASGAFRLPVPPESGYLPGVLVKSEPFVSPADALELRRKARADFDDVQARVEEEKKEKKLILGEIYHRGNRTSQPFHTTVRDFTRHALIAGSTGGGKTTTILYLISQLWREHQVPFLVLYPVDKADYRQLRRYEGVAPDLLVFTLGDESTAPFRFNPFEVPEGFLLKTHLSRLMRVFTAAFTLHDPLPMIYREALRRTYRERGWDPVSDRGEPDREYPIMSEFYQAIREITDGLHYGRELQDNVRQASVIRIGDLLENGGHVVNVRRSMSLRTILNKPTVMEIGRVGSPQDISLLMGFLLMRFSEEVERNPRRPDHPHVTVVEEAHRLMAESSFTLDHSGNPRTSAGEDFGNILAEVRGYGEGIIIAEQIPTLLVKGAIGNTNLKIMHWLEDAPSFELFTNIMNLNDQQREYARTLNAGHAIVRSPFGRPVHIKVPEIEDQPGFDKESSLGDSDADIREYMAEQCRKMGLEDVPIVEWQAGLQASQSEEQRQASTSVIADRLLRAPGQTCAFCQSLLDRGECPHRKDTERLLSEAASTQWRQVLAQTVPVEDVQSRWVGITALRQSIGQIGRGEMYCYLAYEAELALSGAGTSSSSGVQIRKWYRRILREFDEHYQGG